MFDSHAMAASAARSGRRLRRSVGRVVTTAAGFGAAYYFDPECGPARRKQALELLRRTKSTVNEVLAEDGTGSMTQSREGQWVPRAAPPRPAASGSASYRATAP